MRFGRTWAVFEPYGQPRFVTHFEDRDGVVGRHFFAEWAARHDAKLTPAPGAGNVEKLEELDSDHFAAKHVHPLVRHVFERTSATDFDAKEPTWSLGGWLWHLLYNRLIARGMQQLDVPVDPGTLPRRLINFISLLDVDRDGKPDFRIWVRIYEGLERVFYAGAEFTYTLEGPEGTQSYLVVVLPLFGANITVVFQPRNLPNGGMSLETHVDGSYEAGMYLILPGERSYCMLPAFGMREEIRVTPSTDPARGEGLHTTRWLSFLQYQIPYELRRSRPGTPSVPPRP